MEVKNKEIVLVKKGDETILELHNPKFYEDGSLKEGWVANGAWNLRVDEEGQWWSDIGKVRSPDYTSNYTIEKIPSPVNSEQELWDHDPECDHNIVPQERGGVKCTKCGGWFCY